MDLFRLSEPVVAASVRLGSTPIAASLAVHDVLRAPKKKQVPYILVFTGTLYYGVCIKHTVCFPMFDKSCDHLL